ncbi:MAG: homocysteine S-methyltransferase family protein [Propionibacteriales bacterium]|nr:homocysteine S-methyltransferase family protein [Propionibacteriales bacterium]
MAPFRGGLPQLGTQVYLTDSGLETDLVFHHGIDLPEFAAFPLLADDAGRTLLQQYYAAHLAVAVQQNVGFVFESPTWRASADWGHRLGFDAVALDELTRSSVELLASLRDGLDDLGPSFPISGCLGPRGDAYAPEELMTPAQAAAYHRPQVESFAASEADMVNAMTLTHVGEAQGIAEAAREAGMPVALSFTVETDGRLPDGTSLAAAVAAVDDATDGYPAYYSINCAHPTHFASVLDPSEPWTQRLGGVRANASRASHAELDDAVELDDGDPEELGREYAALRSLLPGLTVLGGCCGTDVRHLRSIAAHCT